MPADVRSGLFNQLMQAHTASIDAAKTQKGQSVGTVVDAGQPNAAADVAPVAEPEAPEEAAPDTKSPIEDYYVHTALALERGAVVEFLDAEKPVRSKLSWVSPKQTILLF